MKKLILILALIAISQRLVFSQGCLPEGITFYDQEDIDNFQFDYPGCTEILGDVHIGCIEECDDIYNLYGLIGITSIGGYLDIYETELINLTGLDSLTAVSEISITGNLLLVSLIGLESITELDYFFIDSNPSLQSLSGLESLTFVGVVIYIQNNEALNNITALNALTYIEGGLFLNYNTNLISLAGLENLASIGGNLVIAGDSSLTSLSGLDSLNYIDGGFFLENNPNLLNIIGMENFTYIGENLWIENNDRLKSLSGLNDVASIGGYIRIFDNDSLASLLALNNLTSIGGDLIIKNNDDLSSLSGIGNIYPGSIDNLDITANDSLSECDVLSICTYLTAPGGTITINNNKAGCNSQVEVESACLTSVENINAKDEITLFPNPATTFITINVKEGIPIEEAIIYNHLWQKALEAVPVNNTVDISKLRPGIYFMEVATKEWRGRTKLVKQ
jgi:hypothetical protein